MLMDRALNIQFGTHSFRTLFDEFLRCLGLLQNLKVVQLALLADANWIRPTDPLSCIPENLSNDPRRPREPFTSIEEWYSSTPLFSIAAFCPNLRILGGITKPHGYHSLPELYEVLSYFRNHGPFPFVEKLENIMGNPINDSQIKGMSPSLWMAFASGTNFAIFRARGAFPKRSKARMACLISQRSSNVRGTRFTTGPLLSYLLAIYR